MPPPTLNYEEPVYTAHASQSARHGHYAQIDTDHSFSCQSVSRETIDNSRALPHQGTHCTRTLHSFMTEPPVRRQITSFLTSSAPLSK